MRTLRDQLEENCIGLTSAKIIERKKCVEHVFDLLEKPDLVGLLNDDNEVGITWSSIIKNLHLHLIKEAKKLQEDECKKKSSGFYRQKGPELLVKAIRKANTGITRLTVTELIEYVLYCFTTSSLVKYFADTYVLILRDAILSESRYYGQIEEQEWMDILATLKSNINNSKCDGGKVIECLELLLRWGPMHKLPLVQLRNEFSFITNLGLSLKKSTPKRHQEVILKILLEFCSQHCKDCCSTCCQLGETVFNNLWAVYEVRTNENNIKNLLLEFFLLQVKLHHPRGSPKQSSTAYARSWPEWTKQLRTMHHIIQEEVNYSFISNFKSNNLFSCNNEKRMSSVFAALVVQVLKQVFNCNEGDDEPSGSHITQPCAKRARAEIGVAALIADVQESKSWQWINITTELLKTYPEVLTPEDFRRLLEVLHNLQTECRDPDILSHTYECLYVLIDSEKRLGVSPEAHRIWYTGIWDFAIRSAGLNQNIDVTHKLLQKLITQGKVHSTNQLLEVYVSGALAVNKQSLITICAIASAMGNIPEASTRRKLLDWILNINFEKSPLNTDVYAESMTAGISVMLCMKQWHFQCDDKREETSTDVFDMETVCMINAFEHELILQTEKCTVPKQKNTSSVNPELLQALLSLLKNVTGKFVEFNTDERFATSLSNVLTLTCNVLSFLIKYKVITSENFDEIAAQLNLKEIIFNTQEILLKRLNVPLVVGFNALLSSPNVSCFVLHKIHELVRNEIVQLFYNRLIVNGGDQLVNSEESIVCLKFLCGLSCVRGSEGNTSNQNYILRTLSTLGFDVEVPICYEMVMILSRSLINHEPGTVPDDILQNILEYLLEICKIYYTQYEVVLNLLAVFDDLLVHVKLSNRDDLKEQVSSLIQKFYDLRHNYGPRVSVALLKCMTQISQADLVGNWSKWNGTCIPLLIAKFLKSDYEEVRLTAIKQLLFVFRLSSHDNRAIYQLQEEILNDINLTSREVFILEMTQSTVEQRKLDETITRTATVLHTYGTLMMTNSMWRRRALYSVIELVYEKKLNRGLLFKLLNMVARNLKTQNVAAYLDEYVEHLLAQWLKNRHALSNFPHEFLGCLTVTEFYDKYCHVIVPTLMKSEDVDAINVIAERMGKSVPEILEVSFPRVMASCLLRKSKNTLENLFPGSNLNELMLSKFDSVIVNMMRTVCDLNVMREQLSIQYEVTHEEENNVSLAEFKTGLVVIEQMLGLEIEVMEHCVNALPEKIQSIALKLNVRIYRASGLVDKLRALHHYAIFIILLAPFENKLRDFLVKHFTYSLLHIITAGDFERDVSLAACNFFQNFCKQILPHCAEAIESYLFMITNKLIPLASAEDAIGRKCMSVLNFLIIENAECFKNAIESLDPLPQTEAFEEINSVYNRIKRTGHLQDEIRHFCKAGDPIGNLGCRREALRHLKHQLAEKKNELKELYDALQNVRGFYEDCKDSILHRLIAMLVRLTASPDEEVSLEATRCLGELGPADLTTVILQPQFTPENSMSTPLQFTTFFILEVLCEYAVDTDIEVVQVSSQILYEVLDTKEGKVVINVCTENQRAFLIPFLTKRKLRSDSVIDVNVGEFKAKIDDMRLWYPDVEHGVWIKTLVCSLLECFTSKSYLSKLIPMCEVKVAFCEQLFPYLVYLIMHHANLTCVDIISKCMNDFFDRIWKLTLLDGQSDTIQKSSVHCMLNVVHFIRLQTSLNNSKKMSQLSMNYLKVAQAAYFCSKYFPALLYVELWCQTVITRLRNFDSTSTMLDVICDKEDGEVCENLQLILRRTYTSLGDLDALSGCGYMHLLNRKKPVELYREVGLWEQVVLNCNVEMAHNSEKYLPELTEALKYSQLQELALDYGKRKGDVEYECFWRLSQWSTDYETNKNDLHVEHYKYTALKWLCENDCDTFTESIKSARNSVIESLKHVSLEGTKGLYGSLSQLQCIQELEDLYTAKQANDVDGIFKKWEEQDKLAKSEFEYIRPIKALRISMLDRLLKSGFVTIKGALVEAYLKLSGLAREECDFKVANRTIGNLSLLPDLSEEYTACKMYEKAQICWSTEMKPIARCFINDLLKHNEENLRLRSACLKIYGKWMMETYSENPRTILYNYLFEALDVIKDVEKTPKDYEEIYDTYDVIARFADTQYQRILSYIKSSEFESKVQNVDKSRQAALNIGTQGKNRLSIDEKRAMTIYKEQSVIDQTEIKQTHREQNIYLLFAVKYYLLNLQHSDFNNTRIFRIFSLWLDNRTNPELRELFEKLLPKIPSYKYISILPQLAPHLNSNTEEDFAKQIYSIIGRCCRDHPHHTLPILLALANSNKDDDYSTTVASTESNEPRVLGAQKLLQNLKREAFLSELITNMENLSEALLELAYLKSEKCTEMKRGEFTIPGAAKIRKIKNLSNVLLPTCTLEINKSRNYSNTVGIQSFGKDFFFVGGVNMPKKVTCRGTDGIVRTQLVKGKDDLRQDAVMQQVFTIMNTLLRSNKQTSKLLIRTYKVVPLSRRSGVLEWVENSMMIGQYLANAHKKYNAGDWPLDKCRQTIKNCQNSTNEKKLEKFKSICSNLRPVMHKFFEENFPQPVIWYERRRAYMHSVATSSMCGYILGLGDRHVLNILLDKTTAEVIHIDFGIAFEQGRILPIPETVPFRLSRDIQDGMGVSGIEGVFRRACEKTMEVLRQNSQTIVTILEVLLYDPLYAWTITPAEAYSKQLSDEDESIKFLQDEKIPVNVSAERALLKLRQKLQGVEEGNMTSVEGQVEKLLQEARDYANLSRLYYGWQAYL